MSHRVPCLRPRPLRFRSPADQESNSRRGFLRAAGVTVSLPTLASTCSASTESSSAPNDDATKRLVCIGTNLGLYRPAFYPKRSGRDWESTPLTDPLQSHRGDLTIFSGLDHRASNGHKNWDNYLCGQRVGDVSLDQIVAEHVGATTRFDSVQLCAGDVGAQKMVYNRAGVPLPMINRPSVIYRKLFATGQDRRRTEALLRSNRSALDMVRDQAKTLRGKVGRDDRQKLDEYFQSLRELETRMGKQLEHLAKPDAMVDYELPAYDPVAPTLMLECEQIMYDIMALAIQTDSTRVATLHIPGLGQVFTLDGKTLRAGYHALSHHGNDPDLINDLVRVETEHMRCLANFLSQLKTKTDASGRPLLDTTAVMFGTGMGDASRHSNRDLPIIIAGGGFDHGRHVATDSNVNSPPLLGNVYVRLLQRFGIETDRFSNATGGIDGWA